MPPLTAYVISHTHWDREWYQPFQEFRVRLVAMVDRLLDLLDADAGYRHFMLDGQAIVLDDYLAIRPDRRGDLERHVSSGRLLVGPWYVLPDEFLVGPESLVRNLLRGRAVADGFGCPMPVGYIPDTFGHISQLPQLFNGFGLATAAVWRGLPDLPTVFSWRSPDGSAVAAANLREGYGDLAWAPADPDGFAAAVRRAVDRLAPHAPAPFVLLMDGSDHLEARPDLPALLDAAKRRLAPEGIRLLHATLPGYLAAVRQAGPPPAEAAGEFRGSRRSNILPGVLSSRMWIKQRNREAETLLTAWAESFSAIAGALAPAGSGLDAWSAAGLLAEAWHLLLQNQPHDSICGCGVDQVHEEMRTRYDQAGQVGEEVARRSLAAIAGMVNTTPAGGGPAAVVAAFDDATIPVVVFNPTGAAASGAVTVQAQIPPWWRGFRVTDSAGREVACVELGGEKVPFSSLGIEEADVVSRMGVESAERIAGQEVLDLAHDRRGDRLHITALLGGHGLGDREAVAAAAGEIRAALAAEPGLLPAFHISVVPRTFLSVAASEVPACGYAAYYIRPASEADAPYDLQRRGTVIENESLRVAADPSDGSLTLTDKRTGAVYPGLNRFVDDGDRGDEYNFCLVPGDVPVREPSGDPTVLVSGGGGVSQTLEIYSSYLLPVGLVAGRSRRAARKEVVSIVTRATLASGAPRLDIEASVFNTLVDHRLRVAFPFPAVADTWRTETPWDVVERPVSPPDLETDPAYSGWQERPVAQQPQYRFCDVSAPGLGLMLANRGLPEAEARRGADGRVTLYLTLLRCVGWLSRDDLPVRRGHAGPGLATPGAQEFGRQTFQYSVVPHDGDWVAAMPLALSFTAPPRAVTTTARPGPLPPRQSFVAVEPAGVTVSALKRSEDGRGLVLRLWNAGEEAVTARVRLGLPVAAARLARLDETPLEALPVVGDSAIEVPLRRRQAVTLLLSRQ